jgi:subtilase family
MNWAIKRVKVPEAWEKYRENLKHNIRVGIIDARIDNNHPDFKIPNSNISNGKHKIDSHGTRVMGIIAAIHYNDVGISVGTCFEQ